MAAGLEMLRWPGRVHFMLGESPFVDDEAALIRLIAMLLTIVRGSDLFGGRTGGRQCVAATVLDRLILVPLVLVPIALAGAFPTTML